MTRRYDHKATTIFTLHSPIGVHTEILRIRFYSTLKISENKTLHHTDNKSFKILKERWTRQDELRQSINDRNEKDCALFHKHLHRVLRMLIKNEKRRQFQIVRNNTRST